MSSYQQYFMLVFAWFIFLGIFCKQAYDRLSRRHRDVIQHDLSCLERCNQVAPANFIRHSVLPIWNIWIQELPGFVRMATVMGTLSITGAMLAALKAIDPFWGSVLLAITLVLSLYSFVVVCRRRKLIELGCDLLYTTCEGLRWHFPSHRDNIVQPKAMEQLLQIVNDEQVWQKLSHGRVTRWLNL